MLLRIVKERGAALITIAAAAVLVGIDRLTKWLAVEYVMPELTVPVLKIGNTELLNFTYLQNNGAAFGILSGRQSLLIAVTGVFLVGALIVLLSGKIKSRRLLTALGLIVGGGVGNLIDRVLYGYVIDFIELRFVNFAIFNFADICAVVGALMMFWAVLSDEAREYKAKKACATDSDGNVKRRNSKGKKNDADFLAYVHGDVYAEGSDEDSSTESEDAKPDYEDLDTLDKQFYDDDELDDLEEDD